MAEDISEKVRIGTGAISRQAVYDALNVMAENGLIHRIQPADSAARYEDRVDNNHPEECQRAISR